MRFYFSCGAGVPVMGFWEALTARGLIRSHCFEAESVEEALRICDHDIGDGRGGPSGWRGPYEVAGRSRWTRRTPEDRKRDGRGGVAILELIP